VIQYHEDDYDLFDIDFLTRNVGIAVGRGNHFLMTNDGGVVWREEEFEEFERDDEAWDFLSDIECDREGICRAVGNHGTAVISSNHGLDWQLSPRARKHLDHLTAVHFFDDSEGIAVGLDGQILQTTDGGWIWTVYQPLEEDLHDMCFQNTLHGWIVGENGLILRTTDRGQKWIPIHTSLSCRLLGINFGPDGTGWIVGEEGLIVRLELTGEDRIAYQTETAGGGRAAPRRNFVGKASTPIEKHLHQLAAIDRIAIVSSRQDVRQGVIISPVGDGKVCVDDTCLDGSVKRFIELPVGEHSITTQAKGRHDRNETVDVTLGKTTELKMRPVRAKLDMMPSIGVAFTGGHTAFYFGADIACRGLYHVFGLKSITCLSPRKQLSKDTTDPSSQYYSIRTVTERTQTVGAGLSYGFCGFRFGNVRLIPRISVGYWQYHYIHETVYENAYVGESEPVLDKVDSRRYYGSLGAEARFQKGIIGARGGFEWFLGSSYDFIIAAAGAVFSFPP
jgi:hypothetical protein